MIDVAMQIVKSDIARQTSLGDHCPADAVTSSQKDSAAQAGFGTAALHQSMKSTNQQVVTAWT